MKNIKLTLLVSLGLMLSIMSGCSSDSSSSSDPENTEKTVSEEFYISPITDEIFARIKGKSFKDDCTLPKDDLRYLHVLHKDLNGKEHAGEMIVNVHIAETVLGS